MDTSVQLQEAFHYNLWPIVGLIVLAIGLIILFLILAKKYPNARWFVSSREKMTIKSRYGKRLDEMSEKLNQGTMTNRDCFQELSICVREFAYEMTGVDATKYTLKEIKKMHIPALHILIESYYEPEFAYQSIGDGQKAIRGAKEVIETWE